MNAKEFFYMVEFPVVLYECLLCINCESYFYDEGDNLTPCSQYKLVVISLPSTTQNSIL